MRFVKLYKMTSNYLICILKSRNLYIMIKIVVCFDHERISTDALKESRPKLSKNDLSIDSDHPILVSEILATLDITVAMV